MAILTEEVGEVAKIVARKYGEQSLKKEDNIDTNSIFKMVSKNYCKIRKKEMNRYNGKTQCFKN